MPGRTLQSLHLDPLAERVRASHGRVYRGSAVSLHLLVDINNAGAATYTEPERGATAGQ